MKLGEATLALWHELCILLSFSLFLLYIYSTVRNKHQHPSTCLIKYIAFEWSRYTPYNRVPSERVPFPLMFLMKEVLVMLDRVLGVGACKTRNICFNVFIPMRAFLWSLVPGMGMPFRNFVPFIVRLQIYRVENLQLNTTRFSVDSRWAAYYLHPRKSAFQHIATKCVKQMRYFRLFTSNWLMAYMPPHSTASIAGLRGMGNTTKYTSFPNNNELEKVFFIFFY